MVKRQQIADLAGKSVAAPAEGDHVLAQHANVALEDDANLQSYADKERVALLAYIGPYAGIRVSPVHYITASITLFDEFAIENVVKELKNAETKKLLFLINSFGGAMEAAYKIARVLRSEFNDILTFVPHIAASGGTLFALIGNKIVMGPMSHITPLDPQIYYNGNAVSATSAERAFDRAARFFEKTTVQEAPYAHKSFTDRLDPFILEEWKGIVTTARMYVSDVLRLGDMDEEDAAALAEILITQFPSHSFCIGRDIAIRIGLPIEKSETHAKIWELMRVWLGKYLFEGQAQSCIRYVIPSNKRSGTRKTKQAKAAAATE